MSEPLRRTVEEELELYKEAYKHLMVQLAVPPEGWFTLGHHRNQPDVRLEFWGTDEAGVPLWERPVNE